VTSFLVLFVLATKVLFQRPWLESIMFSLALAVGLTPELLPMVVTVTLARGALRLAGRGVIAKRLAAIQATCSQWRARRCSYRSSPCFRRRCC
jgi:P-type Mg2+ transporter